MNRRLNPVAVITLVALAITLSVGVHFVHGIQVKRNAGELLVRADREEMVGNLQSALQCVSAYVSLRPGDVDARARLGMLAAKLARSQRHREWRSRSHSARMSRSSR